jgi:hypothetical protein
MRREIFGIIFLEYKSIMYSSNFIRYMYMKKLIFRHQSSLINCVRYKKRDICGRGNAALNSANR